MRAQDFLLQSLNEDLRKWFKEKWVRFGPDGKIRGDCARGDDSEGKPKCLPQSKAHALGKKGRASAASRKRRQDPNPERRGAAINVATKKKSNEALIREVQNKMFHEILADRLPAGIVKDEEIVRSAWEIAAQKMGPARATRLFREVPGFEYDLVTAYRAKHSVNEASDQHLSDAESIGVQIRDHMDEYYNLQRSGRKDADTLAAINMSKRSIAALNQELQQLGYKYAPTAPGMVAIKGTPYVEEGAEQCPECGGPMFSDLLLAEKKDACYNKVRSRYKVWPSAYASGALVQCRKKGAANWGNKSKNESVAEEISADQKRKTYDYIYQIMVKDQPEFMYRANNADVKKAILQVMNYGDQISPHDMASYAYGLLKSGAIREQGVAEGSLNEFAPAGSGGGTPPRGPRIPGGPGGGDGGGAGEDPYGRPVPRHYARSIDYFGKFEADHFDKENFNKATGEFRGYWQNDDGGFTQIGYFKFDDPRRTGSDDPGMGWYYEPMDESLNEFTSRDDDGDQGEDDDAMEAQFTVIIAGKPQTGTVRVFPGTTTDVEYYLNGKVYIKNDMQNVDDYDDFIENAAGYIQEIIQLKGDGHHFVEQGLAEAKGELWRVLEPRNIGGHAARYYVVKGHGKDLEIWRSESGAGDFIKQADAEAKAAELNKSMSQAQLDERCWDTHRQEGMKKKGNRMVPNCVPKESIAPKSAIGAAIAQTRR